MRESRIANEKQFFDRTFETGGRKPVQKFYQVVRSSRTYYENYLLSHSQDKDVMEYGCGKGTYVFLLAKNDARVTGIDISEVAINMAKAQAQEQGIEEIKFLEQDAEAMNFVDNSFDLIFGTSILHHLNLERALREISRVLKPYGRAVFIEPLGHNPLINLYRKLTPRFRTADEHPLTMKDLKFIKTFFNQHHYRFFHLFSIIAVPFRNTSIFSFLLKLMDSLDNLLFKFIPCLRPIAWQVVIILEQPKKMVLK